MVAYVVEALDDVSVGGVPVVDGMDLMSPFVWADGGTLRILLRVVPNPLGPHDPTGLVYAGASRDGLHFDLDSRPALTPGPDAADAGGCEDPTVVQRADGSYAVYFTGVDAARAQGSMLVAEGPTLTTLTKRAVVLQAPPGEGNIKEATLAQARDGTWRLFYEYARENASRIGVAGSHADCGPWTSVNDPFDVRDDSWDNWHLSTGPIVQLPGRDPVMFYNGATADARWRIGWVAFDRDFERVTARGIEPLIMPPPPRDRAATDIAFAASAIVAQDGRIHLYYSLEDRRLARAIVRCYD
ncbi:Glycosidase [Sphingomonas sp. EC-HK361]|nr:Glycosidase [Sphingomonas sp. EC-HK361]